MTNKDLTRSLRGKMAGFALPETLIVAVAILFMSGIAVPNLLRMQRHSHTAHLLHELRAGDAPREPYTIPTLASSDNAAVSIRPGMMCSETGVFARSDSRTILDTAPEPPPAHEAATVSGI